MDPQYTYPACGSQAFLNDIEMISNQKDIFLVHKIVTNNCVDTDVDDLDEPNNENAKIEKLCEMSVDTSYKCDVNNAIDFRILRCFNLSSVPLEA